MNFSDLEAGPDAPSGRNESASPRHQSHRAQNSAMAHDQDYASDYHEHSSEGGRVDPATSNDAAQDEPQMVTVDVLAMLSTKQDLNQQDMRRQNAVAPRSAKRSTNQPNLAQKPARPCDEDQPDDEQSSERRQTGPSKSDGAAQEEVQTNTYVQPQPKMLSTSQIWNQQDTRRQNAPPPRSTQISPQDVGSASNNNVLHGNHRPQVSQVHQSNLGHDPPNPPMSSSKRQAKDGQTKLPPRAYSPGMPKDDINERDLEAGTQPTHGLKRDKDKYDLDGRERVILPKRGERQQAYTPPKSNYGPGAIPPPQPTYLDRHGRTELQVFQALVGVHFLDNAGAPISIEQKQQQPASVMSDIFVPSRAASYRYRNRGLYDRCISMDMKIRVMYSFSHYMISFLYLLQILVAATLTAISSYTNIASVAITILGAINTVLAETLAWLNGQGMPNRYRRARATSSVRS